MRIARHIPAVHCAHLMPKLFNPHRRSLGRILICFEQASLLPADHCAHFSTVPLAGLKLLG